MAGTADFDPSRLILPEIEAHTGRIGIVPAFMEEPRLEGPLRTMADFAAAGYLDAVVLASHNSTDGTADKAKEVASDYPGVVYVVEIETQEVGKDFALRSAIRWIKTTGYQPKSYLLSDADFVGLEEVHLKSLVHASEERDPAHMAVIPLGHRGVFAWAYHLCNMRSGGLSGLRIVPADLMDAIDESEYNGWAAETLFKEVARRAGRLTVVHGLPPVYHYSKEEKHPGGRWNGWLYKGRMVSKIVDATIGD